MGKRGFAEGFTIAKPRIRSHMVKIGVVDGANCPISVRSSLGAVTEEICAVTASGCIGLCASALGKIESHAGERKLKCMNASVLYRRYFFLF